MTVGLVVKEYKSIDYNKEVYEFVENLMNKALLNVNETNTLQRVAHQGSWRQNVSE